jgi:hypothetical protein
MGDRNLSKTLEKRNEYGPFWWLDIERSSNGQPDLFFTIREESYDPARRDVRGLNSETSVVVNGWAALAAPLMWLLDEPGVRRAIFEHADSPAPDDILNALVAYAQRQVQS